MAIEVGLLGPIEATLDGVRLNIGGARQRRLLAYLALKPGHLRSLDGVIDAMWPDGNSPTYARASVHTAISRLRSSLADPSRIFCQSGGYCVANVGVDTDLFVRLVSAAQNATRLRTRCTLFTDALAQWRGAALEEFANEDWALADAVRLDELRAQTGEDLGQSLLDCGESGRAVVTLEEVAARSQLRERTHRLLMEALCRDGRRAEALLVFERHRARLVSDIGLEPSNEIQAFESAIASGRWVPIREIRSAL